MTYPVATTPERVRIDKSVHCACARMRDMRLDESWTGRIWDHHSGGRGGGGDVGGGGDWVGVVMGWWWRWGGRK